MRKKQTRSRVGCKADSIVRPPSKFEEGDTLVATALKCRFTGKQFIVCASSRADLSTVLPFLSCSSDKDAFRKVVLRRPNPGREAEENR